MAQDNSTQAPPNPQAQALANRKARVEVRKLTAEARKAELDALVPKLPADLAGALNAPDKASPVGALAAYRALSRIGRTVATAVPHEVTALWIVPDDLPARARGAYELISAELTRFEASLARASALLDAAPTGTPGDRSPGLSAATAVPAIVAAALPSVAALFKTETTVRGRDVAIGFLPLAATVAQKVRDARASGPPRISVAGFGVVPASGLVARLAAVEESRDRLAERLASFRATAVDEPTPDLAAASQRLAGLRTALEAEAKKATPELAQLLADLEQAARNQATLRTELATKVADAEVAEAVLEAVDAFLTSTSTPGASGSQPPLAMAAAYDAHQDAHVLVLDPSFAGAESVYEEKVGKDRGLHLGVVAATYLLLAPDGTLVASGTVDAGDAARTVMGKSDIVWADEPD